MPRYFYIAKNQKGEELKEEGDSSSEKELVSQLRKDGYWPITIREIREKKAKSGSFFDRLFSVPLKNKMIFCRHLAVMISSGLSVSRALVILENQEKNKTFKTVIGKLANDLKKGVSFADAASHYPGVFSAVFVSMIRMGELSGNLEEVLKILADQMEKDHKLVSKVRGAMIYPAIIIVVMIVIGILMMIFVVPKITGIFKDFNAELPFLTKLVIDTSDFLAANAIVVIVGMIGLVVLARVFAKTSTGRRIFHLFFLRSPVIGPIVVKINSARFSRILSSLLESGISLVEALKITADTLGNYHFKKVVSQAADEVQKGVTLSAILEKNSWVFPYLVIQMIEVGEETGKTPDVLLRLAKFYEEEVDQVTKNLSSVIEPVLMVLIGAVVGLFAISIIQPIYSIMERI